MTDLPAPTGNPDYWRQRGAGGPRPARWAVAQLLFRSREQAFAEALLTGNLVLDRRTGHYYTPQGERVHAPPRKSDR